MIPKKTIAICVPSGRFVDFAFFKSFAQSIGQIMQAYNTAILPVSSPMIFENRNEIARRAIGAGQAQGVKFDYLLWVDDDIAYTFENVQKLFSHLDSGKDFISGLYYNPKGSAILPVAYFKNGERYKWLEQPDLSGVMEVDAVGFGFCAFRMEILQKVFEKYDPRPFDLRPLSDGSLVTEDQVFCERAKELGYKIWLDSDLIVRHAKGYLPR